MWAGTTTYLSPGSSGAAPGTDSSPLHRQDQPPNQSLFVGVGALRHDCDRHGVVGIATHLLALFIHLPHRELVQRDGLLVLFEVIALEPSGIRSSNPQGAFPRSTSLGNGPTSMPLYNTAALPTHLEYSAETHRYQSMACGDSDEEKSRPVDRRVTRLADHHPLIRRVVR